MKPFVIRHHSQVVRQSSAKALCPSSNLGGASNKKSLETPVITRVSGLFLLYKMN